MCLLCCCSLKMMPGIYGNSGRTCSLGGLFINFVGGTSKSYFYSMAKIALLHMHTPPVTSTESSGHSTKSLPIGWLELKHLLTLCEPWEPTSSWSRAVFCLALWSLLGMYSLVSAAVSRGSCCYTPSILVLCLEKSPQLSSQFSKPLSSIPVPPHMLQFRKYFQ